VKQLERRRKPYFAAGRVEKLMATDGNPFGVGMSCTTDGMKKNADESPRHSP
jgi:hypothetical protein